MTPSTWTWDANRQQYYYWAEDQECYVYQHGLRLDAQGRQVQGSVANNPQAPLPEEYVSLPLLAFDRA
jgi:hypothetical protein